MIFKLFYTLTVIFVSIPIFSFAQSQSDIEKEVKNVTNQILKNEKYYESFENEIKEITKIITKNKVLLNTRYEERNLLEQDLLFLNNEQKSIESRIIAQVIKKYSKSIAIKHTSQKSLRSIIDNKIYNLLEKNIQKDLLSYNKNLELITQKISENKTFIANLNDIQKKQKELILQNKNMKIDQAKNIEKLRKKYINHVNKLKKSIISKSL